MHTRSSALRAAVSFSSSKYLKSCICCSKNSSLVRLRPWAHRNQGVRLSSATAWQPPRRNTRVISQTLKRLQTVHDKPNQRTWVSIVAALHDRPLAQRDARGELMRARITKRLQGFLRCYIIIFQTNGGHHTQCNAALVAIASARRNGGTAAAQSNMPTQGPFSKLPVFPMHITMPHRAF